MFVVFIFQINSPEIGDPDDRFLTITLSLTADNSWTSSHSIPIYKYCRGVGFLDALLAAANLHKHTDTHTIIFNWEYNFDYDFFSIKPSVIENWPREKSTMKFCINDDFESPVNKEYSSRKLSWNVMYILNFEIEVDTTKYWSRLSYR